MFYDVVIIGAGVTGTAIARELSKYDLKIALVEKEAEAAFGATKANSGIVHAGFHSAPGMIKSTLCVRGNYLYGELKDELDIPFKRVGELMIARGPEDEERLEFFLKQGQELGVPDLKILRGEELYAFEPHLSHTITAALYAPSAGVINPYEFTYRLLYNAIQNGVEFFPNHPVIGIETHKVITEHQTFEAKYIINAAGVYADKIAEMAGVKTFEIKPRKGQEYLLDRSCEGLTTRVIFPLPSKTSKGILVIPTLDGTLMIGPTAEDGVPADDKSTTNEAFEAILKSTQAIIPEIKACSLFSQFAGVRPVATGDDFIIGPTGEEGFINVAGIQSPGLTAAPAVAELMVNILKKQGLKLTQKGDFNPRVPRHKKVRTMSIEELKKAVAENPQYGKIVCRCERVSEAEIRQAIREGATTLDGIKLRTRAGQGRCQGGFCTYRILEIMSEELGIPMTELTKKGIGSNLIKKDIKND
ncbi:MAG: NAD(P)/FAD-dependent oxidoreductase [Alphaproteobacteria bacterium]|nr:NAD(P)/FAD-dependent oxidoreductase [Alphaproteobacteria bacterium]